MPFHPLPTSPLLAAVLARRVPLPAASPFPSRGFTLTEMLTTVAALIILLGLMVSLARDVRARSANGLTQDILGKLDRLMAQYIQRNGDLPAIPLVAYGNSAIEE